MANANAHPQMRGVRESLSKATGCLMIDKARLVSLDELGID
jgi:hypothetical protein